MEVNRSHKFILQPIARYLRLLQIFGGFPFVVVVSHSSRLVTSKWQIWKLIFYFIVVLLTANSFTIMNMILHVERPFVFWDVYKSVAFSDMDFYVGSIMTVPSSIACFVIFFAIERGSDNLEKLCLQMGEVNIKHFNSGVTYTGRGKLILCLAANVEISRKMPPKIEHFSGVHN